jgi:PAS domain S-box-containing protein
MSGGAGTVKPPMRDKKHIDERTTDILDSLLDPIISVDKESRIVYVNHATDRAFKKDKSELVGKSVWDVLPKNVQITLEFYYHKTLSEGQPSQYDNIKLLDMRCDVHFYPAHNGITIFIHDKSSKWQTEELYRLSLYLLERLNENVFLVRSDGRLFHVNDEACRALGYSRNELIHMKIFDIDPSIKAEKWHDYFADIKKKGAISFESEFIASDGKTFPVEVNANYIMLYEAEYYCVTSRDISERRQNENIRLQLASIIESSDSAIIGKTLDGIITSWNAGAERMFDYTAAEVIGKNISILIPPGFPNDVPYILDKIKNGEHIDNYETVRKTKDGRLIDVSLAVSPIKDQSGRIIGASIIKNDITEKKRIELELQNAKAQSELYVDLMSHDINNMNQVGIGYLQLALENPDLDKKTRSYLTKPLETLENSSQLIENVRKLQLAKMGGMRFKETDLGDVLKEVHSRYANAPSQRVKINYMPKDECRVMAGDLLIDVFSNLVGNSIKHSKGPLVINIILTRINTNNMDYYKVVVEDNGPGISDDIKGRLFTRFSRGDTRTMGRGLGLFLVKSLVEDYHGKVWVEDRVEGDYAKGARFVVMLPAYEK